MFTVKEALKVHHSLHDHSQEKIQIRGKDFPIIEDKDGTYKAIIFGHTFKTQNTQKQSKWTDQALAGKKITWVCLKFKSFLR